MRWTRSALLAAWFVLIASLFFDPLTPVLTSPGNLLSPFHVGGNPVLVQGKPLPVEPYAMGNRIFWTMLLPLIPIVLMVFGHETWRRVCPLSHFSQIPRMLGWQRQVKKLNRESGKVDRILALLPSESWLARNHLYIQFGLLTVGVAGRLLFYNSSRPALIAIFVTVLAAALAVGLLYGGKTWCNYFCPIAVIQDIYTGPGGLFDSKAHIAPSPITQSMCRAPRGDSDQSTCVGCTSNCSDVDLENSYWRSLESNQKRFMYYGFFGVVFAFYTYYFVYAGNWDYYMTGAWTHEPDPLATLLAPGVFIAGRALPIPKLIAVPLYFAGCIALAYALFAALERGYAWFVRRRGLNLTPPRIRHHMLSFCALLTFNLFYVFAGRPNLLLMPSWAVKLVDALIVALSVTWLIRALWRDPDTYRREHLAQTLRRQLARMGFRSESALDGRPIERLTADEVYVLAKTLPNFTLAQKREAYRAVLTEAFRSGRTKSAEALTTLADLRTELGLSETDHHAIIEAIGIRDPALLDPTSARTVEQQVRRQNYREFLLDLARRAGAAGASFGTYLLSADAVHASQGARVLFGVSPEEHARIVGELSGEGSSSDGQARKIVDALRDIESQRFALLLDPRPETILLRHGLLHRSKLVIGQAVGAIAMLGDNDSARRYARSVHVLVGKQADRALLEAIAEVPETIRDAFRGLTSDRPLYSYLELIENAPAREEALTVLARDRDPLIAALAVSALPAAEATPLVNTLDARRSEMPPFARKILDAAQRGSVLDEVCMMADLIAVELFAALDLASLAEIAQQSQRMTFAAGEQICRLGESSSAMYVLVRGETQAWIGTEHGHLTLGRGTAGAVFGELGVITRRPRSASIEVTSPAATVIAIPHEVIDGLLGRDLQAARSILNIVSGYLLDTLAATAAPAPSPAESRADAPAST